MLTKSRERIDEKVLIIGIDENGFLLVQRNNGDVHAVPPNGNSFDYLKGLIIPKLS